MSTTSKQSSILAWVLLLILTLIWGTSFILIKRSLVAFSATEVGALRMVTAGIVLFPFAIAHFKHVKANQWVALFLVGLVGSFIPAFLFAIAETQLNSSLAGVLNALTPIFVLIIGAISYHQKFLPRQILGIILGFAGTIFLIFAGARGQLSEVNFYAFYVVLATFCYGLNANIIKFRIKGLNALTVTSISLSLVTPLAFVYIFGFSQVPQLVYSSHQAQMSLMYVSILGIMSTAIAMGLFNKLIQITSPLFTSSVTYLIPIVAVIWGIWDGEILLIGHFIGMAGILAGVFITNRK